MRAEREELVKQIFPQLRKLCESRRVNWGEVDLRWGISDEQKAEGRVLPICLDEILNCRPYFIGLLGQRYGWVPEDVPTGLIEREPWLDEHRRSSVTELEIIHGVFREEKMHKHAYFYFRDPSILDHLSKHSSREDFEPETAESATKLDRLKQRIRNARDEEVCRLRENFRDPRELGQWILEDFTKLIDRLYPEDEALDPLDLEAAEHEAFAQRRRRV